MSGTIIGAFIALVGVIFNSIYTNKSLKDSSTKQYRANVIGKESIAWISETRKFGNLILSDFEEYNSFQLLKMRTKIKCEDVRKKVLSNVEEDFDGTKTMSVEDANRINRINTKYSKISIKVDKLGMDIFKNADVLDLFLASHGYNNSLVVKKLKEQRKLINEINRQEFKNNDQYIRDMNKLLTKFSCLKKEFKKDMAEILQKEWEKLNN
jgi:hypothetical protein